MTAQLEISQSWLGCTACALSLHRDNVVLGMGDPAADVMFISKGPGGVEDQTGEPWSTMQGSVFEELLKQLGRSFDSVFVDNLVACAPFQRDLQNPDRVVIGNPQPEHIAACSRRLHDVIYTVDPLVVVALGAVPGRVLSGQKGKITDVRRCVRMFKIPGVLKHVAYPLITTYSPAGLVNERGEPVDERGVVYRSGQHKRENSLWDKFRRDLEYVFTMVDSLKNHHVGGTK